MTSVGSTIFTFAYMARNASALVKLMRVLMSIRCGPYGHRCCGIRLGASDSVTRSELDTSFNLATSTYGSFDSYVRKGLGLTDAEITTLRNKLLV